MSRYIDGDALDIRVQEGYVVDSLLYVPLRDVMKSIKNAPSIDIVRCKECKDYDGENQCYRWHDELGFCEYVKPDDFCSYGEPKGEE